jgi:hypothetical protein
MAAQAGMATISGAVDDGLADVRRRAGWLVDMASLNGVSWVTVVTGDYILRRNVAGQGGISQGARNSSDTKATYH